MDMDSSFVRISSLAYFLYIYLLSIHSKHLLFVHNMGFYTQADLYRLGQLQVPF